MLRPSKVRPHAGAGIEIGWKRSPSSRSLVRPLAGAGIEIEIVETLIYQWKYAPSPGRELKKCSKDL